MMFVEILALLILVAIFRYAIMAFGLLVLMIGTPLLAGVGIYWGIVNIDLTKPIEKAVPGAYYTDKYGFISVGQPDGSYKTVRKATAAEMSER